jgi:hypothetical protein
MAALAVLLFNFWFIMVDRGVKPALLGTDSFIQMHQKLVDTMRHYRVPLARDVFL